jgi:hypothetical protein
MKIIKTFPEELSKRDAYKLTESQTARKLVDLAGSIIEPDKWVLFEDEDKTVLSLEADGELFGTISGTFIDAFIKAYDELGAEMGPIRVVTGTSRAGRTYVTCELA